MMSVAASFKDIPEIDPSSSLCSLPRFDPDADAPQTSTASFSSAANDPDRCKTAELPKIAESPRSEGYRQLFRLPADEVLIQEFNCALLESILIQGHLYVFGHHICFYSNIFGFETKKVIAFHEVTCVRKAKTAAIFPTAIEIEAGGKKNFFASFLSRDEAYRLIIDGWSQHGSCDKILCENQDSKIDTCSQDYTLNPLDGYEDTPTLEDCRSFFSSEESSSSLTSLPEVQENVEEENSQCSPCREFLSWKREDVNTPQIPECYTMVVESKFQIPVEEFFRLFFSDEAVDFMARFHSKCGDREFKCSPWYEHEQFGHTRDVSFLHPVKIYLGPKFGHCQEVQKFRAYKNGQLIVETSKQISDVPYGDYFHVEGIWHVERVYNEGTGWSILRVYVHVPFLKKTMLKGKIEQSTQKECQETFAVWIKSAHELLKQKQELAKQEGFANDAVNGNTIPKGLATVEGLSEEVDGGMMASTKIKSPNYKDAMRQMVKLMKGDNVNSGSSVVPSFRKLCTTFSSYLRSRDHLPMLLVLGVVSFLIVMQFCIIFLVARSPKVNLSSQENFLERVSNDRKEAIVWLEKRLHLLMEEILMVESRLQNMQNEYVSLKAHLESLRTSKSEL